MDNETFFEMIWTGAYAVEYMVSLAVSILIIIARWKIFVKAHEPGWAAIIPYYNQYVLYKISGKKKLFWAVLGISIGVAVIYIGFIVYLVVCAFDNASTYSYGEALGGILVAVFLWAGIILACSIAVFILHIFQCIGLAKNFGLSGGYAAGLILVPAVFYCIIAFSKNIQYVGDGTCYGGPNGYMPNGQIPYGQPPVYMNPYTGQPQQGYRPDGYGAPQNYPQDPYGAQPGFQQNPYGAPQQNYGQNPYAGQNDIYNRSNDYNGQ